MKVYFIRHGQTNYNVLELVNDDPTKDVHLTDLGKKQAEEAREKLKDVSFDIVYTSELRRCIETAKIITKDKPVVSVVDARIDDRKTGVDGQPSYIFNKSLGSDLFNFKPKNGESFQEEKHRVFPS